MNSQTQPINIWQTKLWQNFQEKLGYQTWFFQNKKSTALVIKHNLPFGYSWLDIPRGPIGALNILKEIIPLIQKEEPKTIFIRIMPSRPHAQPQITHSQLKKAHANHQPETTLVLDLTQTEEEILKQMKPKGRYNIRLAHKKKVKVYSSKNISKFYNLLKETTSRDNFSGHSQKFYQTMLQSLGNSVQLLLAEYQGKVIAGGIFTYTKTECVYYYGASSNQHRNAMAPYLIQWQAIQNAKKRGCLQYDFLGIAPEDAPKNHPWKGVTAFKKKFGGKIIQHVPAQEIILKPFFYAVLLFYKKIRKPRQMV